MRRYFHIAVTVIMLFACQQAPQKAAESWQSQVDSLLPLLGHRNWIIVADKAFPLQSSAGIIYLNTNSTVPAVTQYVIAQLNAGTHVSPVLYTDKELSFVPDAGPYRDSLQAVLKGHSVQSLLHDSVFAKMDKTASLFKVLVLKTNTTVPYSSVFINLDCKYWSPEKEQRLREQLNNK
ncbi:hypothetical protein [Chitinophaga vietnamensis]|uniref:hypothetical protein n=1 Tax=Chitinophaga vietnamensis TaxID=2593957 RepID=UPI001178073A|nr:hypothetical protein [Chitinophaga vietnamensis]